MERRDERGCLPGAGRIAYCGEPLYEVRIMNATAMSIAAIDVHYDGERCAPGITTTTNVNFFEFSADGVNL